LAQVPQWRSARERGTRQPPEKLQDPSQTRSTGDQTMSASPSSNKPSTPATPPAITTTLSGSPLATIIDKHIDPSRYRQQHWEGTFWEYLEVVQKQPEVARNAFQRVYDMIMSYGSQSFTLFKQEYTRYHFFSDPVDHGHDAIFGLERPLVQLVDFFKSAAAGYGTEKRILLLHGPVGSSKSTIARLMKKGLEAYTRTEEGKLFTFTWRLPKREEDEAEQIAECPMHEEPLLLIPHEARAQVLEAINSGLAPEKRIRLYGEVCPFCRKVMSELMELYQGDWKRCMEHVTVKRLILSEKDRKGIGTFQPKDEKNQDSTELTGDINYRKIAEFGSRVY
jgi:serine protein kinase